MNRSNKLKVISMQYAVGSMQYAKSMIKSFTPFLITACCLLTPFPLFSQTEYEPPKLTCAQGSNPTELNWNLPLTPNPCFTGYEIYVSSANKSGPYVLQTTIANPLQTTAILNTGNVAFVYMINRGSCNNPAPPANKTSDTLSTARPFPVNLQNVSIVNNQIQINWEPSPAPEVVGYFIYNNLDGSPQGFSNPDTVFGRLTTSFTDTQHNPKSLPVTYAVRAFISCQSALPDFVQGGITPPDARHTSVRLNNTRAPDPCRREVSVEWTPYLIGASSSTIIEYKVETNTNNAGYIVQKTVGNTIQNNIVENVPYLQPFCIRIEATLSNGTTAFSNEICFDSLKVIQKPINDYIRNISVENGSIIIEYKKDTLATPLPPGKKPILYRSNDGIDFGQGLVLNPDYEDFYTLLYKDQNLDLTNQPYFYSVRMNDSCSETHYSDTATSLRIGIKVKSNNRADIVWSGFDVDNITFDHYELEKITGADTSIAGTFNRSQTGYLEQKLFDYSIDSLDNVCYRLTAVFTNNNDPLPRETLRSHSNTVCAQPEPQAFVPQAFVPEGLNKTFKPFLLFSKKENYDFKIYDRWCRLLFSTQEVSESWDGTDKGNPAPLDGYLYVIRFMGKNGQEYTQAGTVMLLR